MKMEEKLSFREAQLGAYEILKFLDELCRKHKFRYFLMYGSLIGAVRNKGIIPWDDDVDFMMPRKDYDQLISYCREHGDDIKPFVLFENSLNINYPHPIARMSDSRYRLDFENEKDYGLGLFVDIYPLDGAGNNIKGAHKLVHKSYRNASLCFLTSRKKFGVDNTKSKMKMALKVPAYLWANAFGNAHYIKKANKLCSTFGYDESAYVTGVAQPGPEKNGENKNIYKKEWFIPVEAEFEDGKFFIPIGYDKILKMGYGDYMTPPSEVDRKTHHTYDVYRRTNSK